MDNETLVNTVISFTELLDQSKTDVVKNWDIEFIQKSVDRCIFIETELSLLQPQECENIQSIAQHQSEYKIPPLNELLDALHEFFKELLQNVFLSNDLYLYIMKNYRFLAMPEENDMLSKVLFTF